MTPEADDHSFTIGISLRSPHICAIELRISLARLEDGQRELQAVQRDSFERISQDQAPDRSRAEVGYALTVQQAIDIQAVLRGIRNVLLMLKDRIKCGGRGSSRLQAVQTEFQGSFPEAKNLRDILEHLPDYIGGKGKLQTRGLMPSDHHLPNLAYESMQDASSEITLLFNFEGQGIEVKAAARKAIEIADLLVEIGDADGS